MIIIPPSYTQLFKCTMTIKLIELYISMPFHRGINRELAALYFSLFLINRMSRFLVDKV